MKCTLAYGRTTNVKRSLTISTCQERRVDLFYVLPLSAYSTGLQDFSLEAELGNTRLDLVVVVVVVVVWWGEQGGENRGPATIGSRTRLFAPMACGLLNCENVE